MFRLTVVKKMSSDSVCRDTGSWAVFLDKDGTLLEDVPFNADPLRMRWADGAEAGVRALAAAGWKLVLVSNQAGLAFGSFDHAGLETMRRRLVQMFIRAGARLDGFYFCPHHPAGSVPGLACHCDCRKPAPGMILRAATELNLDLAHSWMVGDILDDVEAGHRAGCSSVLLNVGNETEWKPGRGRVPDLCAGNLHEAALWLNAYRAGHQFDAEMPALWPAGTDLQNANNLRKQHDASRVMARSSSDDGNQA